MFLGLVYQKALEKCILFCGSGIVYLGIEETSKKSLLPAGKMVLHLFLRQKSFIEAKEEC